MEKFTLTSFKKRGNHEKRLLKSGEIIFINFLCLFNLIEIYLKN